MNWRALRSRLLVQHSDTPQSHRQVELALHEAELALAHLAKFGHLFHLVEGPGPADVPEWPRFVFHESGRRRFIHHPTDLAELGPGWYDTLAEAKITEGLNQQFIGRAGRQVTGLPMVIPQPNPPTRS